MRKSWVMMAMLWPIAAAAQQTLSPLVEHVQISGQDCQRLVKAAVPGAAYQPGVDVHGKPVAPADLPGSGGTFKPPTVVEFNYTVNPTAYGGASASKAKWATAGNTQMPVAHVQFDLGSNQFTLNGQPVGDADKRGLADECRKQGIK